MKFLLRVAVVAALVAVLAACGQDARDIKMADVMSPESAKALREQLSPEEQLRLAKYMSIAMATGQSLGDKTVGDVLDAEEAAEVAAAEDREQREQDRKLREENFYAVMAETANKTAELTDVRLITLQELSLNYGVHREALLKVMPEADLDAVVDYMSKHPPVPGSPAREMTVSAALAAARAEKGS